MSAFQRQGSGKKQARETVIRELHQHDLDLAQTILDCVTASIGILSGTYQIPQAMLLDLNTFSQHAVRQMDQIKRRVIQGESIPHDENVFSLFEPHTEWISKGKAGVPVELGKRVCVIEDTHGFILYHQVMDKQTDQVAVDMVRATQALFPQFNACSFDKGFHSPHNQRELKETLDHVVLPKKGKLSKADHERKYADAFVEARKQHSAVESAINALQVHGLDRCLDHGMDGFERYVAMAVLSRNIQMLGSIVRNRARDALKEEQDAA